jgi:hypothetical protein
MTASRNSGPKCLTSMPLPVPVGALLLCRAGTWCRAADFLRWAYRRRLTTRLTLPYEPRQDPDIVVSEDERWELLSRCLHDTALPIDIRAAGALILLYGLPLTKIVELTSDHLHPQKDEVTGSTPEGIRVTLSSPVIVVPPPLGRILAQLPAKEPNPRTIPLIHPDSNELTWLFPGRNPRGHINASVVARRLKHHGIQPRASRNAALIALAADLPMSVVATLFNLSIAAAVLWSQRAGRAWHAYVAAARLTESRTAKGALEP